MYISIMIFPAVLVIDFSYFTAKSLFRKRPFFLKAPEQSTPASTLHWCADSFAFCWGGWMIPWGMP